MTRGQALRRQLAGQPFTAAEPLVVEEHVVAAEGVGELAIQGAAAYPVSRVR